MRHYEHKLHSNDVFSTNEMSVLIFGPFFSKICRFCEIAPLIGPKSEYLRPRHLHTRSFLAYWTLVLAQLPIGHTSVNFQLLPFTFCYIYAMHDPVLNVREFLYTKICFVAFRTLYLWRYGMKNSVM